MIKVNLLKDAGKQRRSSGDSTVADTGEFKTGLSGTFGDNSALIKRLAFLIVPIVGVFLYTWFIEMGLETNIATLNKESASLDTQLEALKPELDIIEQLKSEKNRLSTEVNTLKDLSKKRYIYIKILDAMQSLIPEKAWITKLSLKEQTVAIEGRATEDSIISSFMQNLEESAYFSNVTWVSSTEVNEPQGVVKSFSIRFTVENI